MSHSQIQIKRSADILRRPFDAPFLQYVGAGILVGLTTGLVVGTFRWIIDQSLVLLAIIYPFMAHHPVWLLPYILFSIFLVFCIGQIVKGDPIDLVRSGVPQIEAILLDKHHMNWWTVLWRKFISGLLTICPGLFLGCEGPCIQIGACIGQGYSEKLFNPSHEDRHLLLQCGVAAGLSAAFSAPLAGTIFLLEELTHRFKIKVWVTAFTAAIASDLATFIFFGTKPCLYLPLKDRLPISSYPWLLLVGILIGIMAYAFQYCILNLKWWYRKFTILPKYYHSILPFLLVIPVGLWNPRVLGGSHNLIIYVTKFFTGRHWAVVLGLLIVILILRFIGTMIAYGSTVPGGIFMPIFVIGSLLGAITGIIMIHTGILASTCYLNMVVIAMAAFFGATEGAPFSAILLVTEMVGSISQIFPMVLLTFIAYYTSMMLGARTSIYEALREEMTFKN